MGLLHTRVVALPHGVSLLPFAPILLQPSQGADISSPLLTADLLPGAEAPATCGQGQAKEGKRALQLKGCCCCPEGL